MNTNQLPEQEPKGQDRQPAYAMYDVVTARFRELMIKELAANFEKGDRDDPREHVFEERARVLVSVVLRAVFPEGSHGLELGHVVGQAV